MPKRGCYTSPEIAEKMERAYGEKGEIVRVQRDVHEDIRKRMEQIEEAHRKTAGSRLVFG
jgi:hypothetical protein